MVHILQAFPLLYLNLGGELLYIIEQRLQAQDISAEKSAKVLNDLLSMMLDRQYLNGIFRSDRLNSPSMLKSLMENIVHSSVMRLGQDSLDKLYDLMAMSVKFQFVSAPDAQSLLAITTTHVDSWMQLTEDPETMLQIQFSKDLLLTHCAKLSPWAWMTIRHSLLNYLQPCKTRITTFLGRGLQNQAGYFHLDNTRPLPEGLVLPELTMGNFKPYNFQCGQSSINLGSNMFNDHQQPPIFRTGGFTSLQRIVAKSTENDTHLNLKEMNVGSTTADEKVESIQLELKKISPSEHDTMKVFEETLLDLFDEATRSDIK